MQSVLRLIYPPQCVSCGDLTEDEHRLCGSCWRDAHFIGGTSCHACGVPLMGEATELQEFCDDCLDLPRPWDMGRAAMEYRGIARRLVLGLKHGDRMELGRAGGLWLARAGAPLFIDDPLLVPIPLHWRRMFRRTYNQAAVLANWLGQETGLTVLPDALTRPRATKPLDDVGRDARFAALDGAFQVNSRHRAALEGRAVVLVDDVMTSGATFGAATEALRSANAGPVRVLALARAVKGA